MQAYDILSDGDTRYVYNQQLQQALIDALDDYTGEPYSKWLVGHKLGRNEDPYEERALFVVRIMDIHPPKKLATLNSVNYLMHVVTNL